MNALIAFLFFCGTLCWSQSDLTFNFSVPYAGGGTVQLNNQQQTDITISSLQFVSNAVLSGSPWGDLFPSTATLSSTENGILFTYTVDMGESGAIIPAMSSSSLTYEWTSSQGPLGLGMGPSAVSVTIDGKNVNVNIDGYCSDCTDPTPGTISSGYYTSWGMYGRQYNAIDIPVKHINHILYAFIGYQTDGSLYLLDSNSDPKQIPVIAELKQKYSYLHAALSFGGWTLSAGWSSMANNTESLNNFVSNVIEALQETQFDGVDIDWEYPVLNGAPGEPTYKTPWDATSYANLLSTLRTALDDLALKNKEAGYGATSYDLTIAGPGGTDKLAAISQYDSTAWETIQQSVSWVNVMTYDFHGAFDQDNTAPYDVTDFMSAMETSPDSPFFNDPLFKTYNIIDPIMMYQKLGFPMSQLAIGIPCYGRMSMIAQIGPNDGLYQQITGTPIGQYDNTGTFDYKCIQEAQCHGYKTLPSDMVLIDPTSNPNGNYSHAPWGYSQSTLTFLTYDDHVSAKYKACWVAQNKLRGWMIWDLTGDFEPSDPNSIVGACYAATNGDC